MNNEMMEILNHIRYLAVEISHYSDYIKRMKDHIQETDLERIGSVKGMLEYMLDEMKMYSYKLNKRERESES